VESVNVVQQAGEGSGLGAIAGGVAGAVLGNQVGRGTGRKVATVAGAAGGAFAGHQVEKHVKSSKRFDVTVRMEDGSMRTFPFDNEPGFRSGDRVRVVEGRLQYN
jgi:outer membrane lipoprotein SlyB